MILKVKIVFNKKLRVKKHDFLLILVFSVKIKILVLLD